MRLVLAVNIFLLMLIGCTEVPVPKPSSYYRIDLPSQEYAKWDTANCPFTFKKSTQALIERSQNNSNDCYYDLKYNDINATIYLSYLPVKGDLKSLIDQEYSLREKHNAFSTGVKERLYRDSAAKVNAMIFDVQGIRAATPLQFFITDSTNHFFRGALYFYNTPNNDSLAPVIKYIKEDIDTLVSTFQWK